MNNKLLKYSDIVLVPKLSEVTSRSEVNIECTLGNKNFGLPVIPANMKTVIDINLARSLSDSHFFYVMHRFGISNYDFVKTANKENWRTISISVGVKSTDLDVLRKIHNDNLRIDYIKIILIVYI